MKPLLTAVLYVGMLSCSRAQTSPSAPLPPLPSGPLLERAPELSQWQVTITNASDSAPSPQSGPKGGKAAAAKPAKTVILSTKAGSLRHDQTVDQDGQRMSRWCVGATAYMERTGWNGPIRYSGQDRDGYYANYAESDFPECAWVSAKNYVGVQSLGDRPCIVFNNKAGVPPGHAPGDTAGQAARPGGKTDVLAGIAEGTAYIDLETRHPVAMRKDSLIYVYQMLPPPATAPVIPPNIARMIEAEEKSREDLIPHPARS